MTFEEKFPWDSGSKEAFEFLGILCREMLSKALKVERREESL